MIALCVTNLFPVLALCVLVLVSNRNESSRTCRERSLRRSHLFTVGELTLTPDGQCSNLGLPCTLSVILDKFPDPSVPISSFLA